MYPRGLEKTLEADHHQKVTMTFSLKDISSGKVMTAHQVWHHYLFGIKEYRMVFRAGLRDPCTRDVRIAWSMHEGCRETFGKRKNTRAAGECIFTLSESRAKFLQKKKKKISHLEYQWYHYNHNAKRYENVIRGILNSSCRIRALIYKRPVQDSLILHGYWPIKLRVSLYSYYIKLVP
jgi:hypothetical protein